MVNEREKVRAHITLVFWALLSHEQHKATLELKDTKERIRELQRCFTPEEWKELIS